MTTFIDALPELGGAIEAALLHIGRGDIVDQLREASIERWSHDDFADTTSLFVKAAPARPGISPRARTETISIYDEVGVILETDASGRLVLIEVSGGKDIVARLDSAHSTGAGERK